MRAVGLAVAAAVLFGALTTRAFAEPPPDASLGMSPVEAPPAAPPQTSTTAQGRLLEVSVFGHIGRLSLAARESFDAVLGTSSGQVVGGGGEVGFVRGRLKGVFARVDLSRFREHGERVFVLDGEVFGLGIPLDVTLTPIEVTGGYRHRFRGSGGRPFPLEPYGGIGVGTVQYREESSFAEPGENVDDRFVSYHVLGGVDVRIWRSIGVGVEGQYRWVPDGLGAAGVSKEFNETNLGGATIRVKAGVTF